MERRLVSAFDRMTMPDGCSQRIEETLRRRMKPERGRHTAIMRSYDRKQPWRSAVMACLVFALLVGGTALFVITQGQPRRSNVVPLSPATDTTAASETLPEDGGVFPYGEEADEFLKEMCRFMPDWSGSYSLDDYFWRNFLYASFSRVKLREGGLAETIIGQVPYLGKTVLVSREQAEDYAMLATGLELPEFQPEDMIGSEGFQYADGYYRISDVSDSDVVLEDIELKISWEEGDYRKDVDWKFGTVVYSVSAVREDTVLATDYVVFYLQKAENENGFIILAKTTDQDLYSFEDKQIQEAARAFGEAYFVGDTEGMRSLMTDRDDWSLLSDPISTNDGVQFQISDVSLYRGLLETLNGNPVAGVRYRCLPSGSTEYVDTSLVLYMEMAETDEGWKVRYFHTGMLDEIFADQDSLRNVAEQFSEAYMAGDKDKIRSLMGKNAPKKVAVYDGDLVRAGYGYVDIISVSPGAEPEAEARISFYNGEILTVKLVRQEEGWVVESYEEQAAQHNGED